MYKIAVMSCAEFKREFVAKYVIEDPFVQAIYLNGDFSYFADSVQIGPIVPTANSVALPASEWPLRSARLFNQPGFQDMLAMRSSGVKIFWDGDDHMMLGNNWDFSVEKLNEQNGPTVAATLPSEVLQHWRLSVAGTALVEAGFDNPPRGVNTVDQPAAMVGVTQASKVSSPADYPIRYFYTDYGPSSARTRFIKLDCVSYKSLIASTDNASKTLLGATQKAWLRQSIADAVAQGFVQVIIVSSKDLFNLQNSDGWFSYSTEREAELTYYSSKGWPVVWACGDRHNPHVAMASIAGGDPYNVLAVCATPMCVGITTLLTAYPQNVWQAYKRLSNNTVMAEPQVFEMITVDDVNSVVRHAVIEAATGIELWGANVPFGAALPA